MRQIPNLFPKIFHSSRTVDSFGPRVLSRRMSSFNSRDVLFLNIDSSYNRDQNGGNGGHGFVGLFVRAENGQALRAASAELGYVESSSHSELKGLEVALLIMRKQGLHGCRTFIRTDCQEVRNLVRDYVEGRPSVDSTRLVNSSKILMINSIKHLYNKSLFTIEWVPRRFNFMADLFSNILIPPSPHTEKTLLNTFRRAVNPKVVAERTLKGLSLSSRLGMRNAFLVDFTNMESKLHWKFELALANVEFKEENDKVGVSEPFHPFAKYVFCGPTTLPHSVSIPVPSGTNSTDITCRIAENHIKVGLKGQKPVLHVHDCSWSLAAEEEKYISIRLIKQVLMDWWKNIVNGEPERETQKVEHESNNLSDLDTVETRTKK